MQQVFTTMGRILVAVDGSKNALAACGLASSIAEAAHAKITLLFVSTASAPETRNVRATIQSRSKTTEQRVLDEAADAVGNESLILERKVSSDRKSLVKAITDYAELGRFDLVILGTRGLGGFRRLTVGSVSSGVATHSSRPVLVVRSGPAGRAPLLKRFLVATDGSSNSKHAVVAAASLARLLGAELEILHVIHMPETAYATTRPAPIGEMEEGAQTSGEKLLAEAVSLAESVGTRATGEVRKGVSPAQGIVDFAAEKQSDLIIVGGRGMGGFKKLLLGSVSNSVLHYANCSVLVVK